MSHECWLTPQQRSCEAVSTVRRARRSRARRTVLQRRHNGKLYYMATGRGHCNVRYVHLNDVSLQPRASERASLDAKSFACSGTENPYGFTLTAPPSSGCARASEFVYYSPRTTGSKRVRITLPKLSNKPELRTRGLLPACGEVRCKRGTHTVHAAWRMAHHAMRAA